MLTVACVWTRSEIFDSAEWVHKLYRMADQNLRMTYPNFRFVCITPHQEEFQDHHHIHTIYPYYCPHSRAHASWYKANLFQIRDTDRVLYLDLDVVVMRKLTPLVEFPSDFVCAPPSSVPIREKDFNSSVMVWNTESEQIQIIRNLVAKLPWDAVGNGLKPPFTNGRGDQKWLSSLPIRVDLFPSRWVKKYFSDHGIQKPPEETIVSLCIQGGKNKALIDSGHTWIAEYWK